MSASNLLSVGVSPPPFVPIKTSRVILEVAAGRRSDVIGAKGTSYSVCGNQIISTAQLKIRFCFAAFQCTPESEDYYKIKGHQLNR